MAIYVSEDVFRWQLPATLPSKERVSKDVSATATLRRPRQAAFPRRRAIADGRVTCWSRFCAEAGVGRVVGCLFFFDWNMFHCYFPRHHTESRDLLKPTTFPLFFFDLGVGWFVGGVRFLVLQRWLSRATVGSHTVGQPCFPIGKRSLEFGC